jgi:predicted SprT family Zn-dependent metalloprotease
MKFGFIALSLLLSLSVNASQICAPKISLNQFTYLLKKTVNQYFPELVNESIEVSSFRSDAYFLQAQPVVKTIAGKRGNRKYHVQLNLKLLDCPPSEESLQAILVHELEHIKDYTEWSSAKLIKHGMHYSTSLMFRAKYERATDAKVLEKGLNSGLAGYRVWVYQWLSPKELQRKRYIYLTPEEIFAFDSAF